MSIQAARDAAANRHIGRGVDLILEGIDEVMVAANVVPAVAYPTTEIKQATERLIELLEERRRPPLQVVR